MLCNILGVFLRSDILSTMSKHFLEVPWDLRSMPAMFGAKWSAKDKFHVYEGADLPEPLLPFATQPFTWARWLEDEANGRVGIVPPGDVVFKPRDYQVAAAKKIVTAFKQGYRGFLEADATGVGKTLSCVFGALGIGKMKGSSAGKPLKVLILCPKGVIPHWQNTLLASPLPSMARIVVSNYEQMPKMLSVPASAKTAKRTRTRNQRIARDGVSLVDWDVVIADEAQKLKGIYTSQRAKEFSNIAQYASTRQDAPFIIYASATPGETPIHFGYMAPVVGSVLGMKNGLTLKGWGKWLESQGFNVKEGKAGSWSWGEVHYKSSDEKKDENARANKQDILKLRKLFFNPKFPSIRRHPSDIAGWPETNLIPFPVSLGFKQLQLYEEAWTAFRQVLRLGIRGRDPKGGLAAQLRFRQKSSMLRVDATVEQALEALETGHQVAISLEFLETLDTIREELEKKRVKVAEYSGRNDTEREIERLRFQRGEAKVILFTPTEGFSLHAKETLPTGEQASPAPRVLLLHDIRYTAIANTQIVGRCHRDGQFVNNYLMFAKNTVEEKIINVMINRMRNMKSLAGDSEERVGSITDLLEQIAQEP